MTNMLIYVEENLLYSPEQCYEDESTESESNNKNFDDKSINAPLISPQSTLDDKAFKFPLEVPLSNEAQKLSTITEESLQNQSLRSDSPSVTFSLPKMSTNPFLQDEFIHSQIKDELTPEKFMQLWNENLKLQMQITATFHLLFDRVMKNSEKNINGNSVKDENILKMMNMFLQTNKDFPTLANFGTLNTPSTKSTVGNNDSINIQYSTGNSVLPTVNEQQSLHFPADNRNLNCNNYADVSQNTAIQNSIKQLTPMCSNYFTPMDNSVGATNQFAMNESYSGFEKFNTEFNMDLPMSPEKSVNNRTPLTETNPFRLSLAGKLQILDSDEEKACLNSDLVSAAQSNQEAVTEHDPTNLQKDTNYGILKNVYNDLTFKYNQDTFPNGSSIVNNINNNSPVLSTQSHPVNYMWSVDNIASNMSKIIIDNPSGAHGINQSKEAEERLEKSNDKVLNFQNSNYQPSLYTTYPKITPQKHIEKQKQEENLLFESSFSPSRTSFIDHNKRPIIKTNEQMKVHANNISNFTQAQFTHTSNFPVSTALESEGMFNCRNANENCTFSSSWIPINSSLSFGLVDNTNIDEGYLTRPSTSHTSYRSSPLVQGNSEIEYNQQSLTQLNSRNTSELSNAPTNMWIKSIEEINTIQFENWNKMYSLSKENENIEEPHDNSQQQNNLEIVAMKDAGKLHANVNDTRVQKLHLTETESADILGADMFKNAGYMENRSSIINYPSLNNKIFFLPVELPKCVVHVFHYQGEGWLLIDEFVKAFTEFKGSVHMMDFLHLLNIHMPVQEISKTQYSIGPLKLGGTLLEATNFVMYSPTNLQLMPIKLTLRLLSKLKIISRRNIDDAIKKEFVRGSVMHAVWLIICAYGQFKYYIENSQHL